MSDRDPGPTPSKIVVAADDQSARKKTAPKGGKTRSWAGIVGCTFPILGLAVAFLFSGVMGEGNTESRYYLLGILMLLFILGAGAGLGFGALFDSRRKRLIPLLAVGFNGAVFFLVLLVSLFPSESQAPRQFESLETTDSASVTTPPPGTGG